MMITKLLLPCMCLVLPALGSHLPYIIGGSKVGSASDYPWQCSLQVDGGHVCGASIISKDWLLTTATCVVGITGTASVDCGSTNWRSGTKFSVSEKIQHESFTIGPGLSPNDIAVMKVNTSMDLSGPNMKAIPLATNDQAGNPDCVITGWGCTKAGSEGTTSEDLMKAHINVYKMDVCKEIYGDAMNAGHVCVGDVMNQRAPCTGDQGGPLVCRVGEQYQLVGAASWWGYAILPYAYSGIPYFKEWVTEKTGVQ